LAAGISAAGPGPSEADLSHAFGRLLHLDDPEWLSCLQATLASPMPMTVSELRPDEQRILTALHFALWSGTAVRKPLQSSMDALWQHPAIREELRQLLALLEDRASVVPTPLARILGWAAPVPLSEHGHYRSTTSSRPSVC
jgi:hypothetical protein